MEFKICKKCPMDGSDPDLKLDKDGVCNHCHNAQRELKLAEKERPNLKKRLRAMRSKGQYDCLIGLSGGVDSSLALHYLVSWGLRPLCYTIDNGWNDPKADENIMRLVEGLKVPFYRYTIDIEKFRSLQAAFMQAGLINLEIPTDHILMASGLELASKYGIKWIVSGGNVATESVMPAHWSYNARDLTHIKDVYKYITGRNLKGLPLCGIWKWNYYRWIKRIKTFYILDYYTYNREEAIKLLQEKYGYKPYGEKHEESIFTKWFQNFYLFQKFGIDKRKAHYSSLIQSRQMDRPTALSLLTASPVYPELGLEAKIMKYPRHEHADFKTDKWYNRIAKFINFWKSLTTST